MSLKICVTATFRNYPQRLVRQSYLRLKWKCVKRYVHSIEELSDLVYIYGVLRGNLITEHRYLRIVKRKNDVYDLRGSLIAFDILWMRAVLTHPYFRIWYAQRGIYVMGSDTHRNKNTDFLVRIAVMPNLEKTIKRYAPEYVNDDLLTGDFYGQYKKITRRVPWYFHTCVIMKDGTFTFLTNE